MAENLDGMVLRFRLILGVVCVLVFIFIVTWVTLENDKKKGLYPRIGTDDKISGKVEFVVVERSYALINFEAGAQRAIYFARNCLYEPSDLPYFIRPGDLLIKKLGSDTLRIVRNEEVFLFINGDDINCVR